MDWTGGFLRETGFLEGAEASAEGQVRGAARLAVLPPDQFYAHADHAKGTQPQSQGHKRQIR